LGEEKWKNNDADADADCSTLADGEDKLLSVLAVTVLGTCCYPTLNVSNGT
jgi:hypothetical protein